MEKESHEWLKYDWQVEGQPACFCVDMSLMDTAPDQDRQVLVYLCCASRDPNADALTPGESRRAETLLNKCLKSLSPIYAGFIETDAQRQYYFYVESAKALESVNSLIEKEKKLLCTAGVNHEPRWQTYCKLLYPDAAKYQTTLNREVTALLKKRGDCIIPSRRVNLHMAFKSELLRVNFEEEARLAGFAIGRAEFHPEQECAHGITLHTVSSLADRDIDALTTRVIRLAEKFEGCLLHWDCQFVPDAKTFR